MSDFEFEIWEALEETSLYDLIEDGVLEQQILDFNNAEEYGYYE